MLLFAIIHLLITTPFHLVGPTDLHPIVVVLSKCVPSFRLIFVIRGAVMSQKSSLIN